MGQKTTIALPIIIGILFMLAGCGSKTSTEATSAVARNTVHTSQTCIDCHEGATNLPPTPGTKADVVTEWKKSVHNTTYQGNVSGTGAGCQDCHGSGYLHPASSCNSCHSVSGVGYNPTHNPDADGVCGNCHAKSINKGFTVTTYDNITRDTQFLHFSTGRRTNYVALNYQGKCRACHNPHDTTTGKTQRQQWARSGHGDSTTNARVSRDFKASGSSFTAENNFGVYCARCHTTTGFINYVQSNFTDVQALPDIDGVRNNIPALLRPTYLDKSREATNCDACHDDARTESNPNITTTSSYSGRVRRVSQVVSYYNFSSTGRSTTAGNTKTQRYKLPSTITYANLPASNFVAPSGQNMGLKFNDYGLSNVCIACHSGREIGMMIKVACVGNPEVNAVRPGQSLPLNFTLSQAVIGPHDRAAASNLNGISGFEFYSDPAKYVNPGAFVHDKLGMAPNYYGDPQRKGNGPCITCHVANNSKSHYFLPFDSNENLVTTSCNGCHSFQASDIQAKKDGLAAALKALQFTAINPNSYSTAGALGASYDNRFQLSISTVRKETTSPLSGIAVPTNIATFSTSHSATKWSVFGRWLASPNPAGVGNGTTFVDYIILGSGNPLNNNATNVITAGAYTMGASFNYTLINNDPGAYAHNPTYVKRLIYDSIDWLDNGKMDGSTAATLTATLTTLAGTPAYAGGATNPAVFASSSIGANKSVTLIVYSGTTTRTYSQFTFTSDDLTKAITFLCGNLAGIRP